MLHFNGKSNIESRGATTIGCGNEGVRVRPSEREIPDLKNRHPAGREEMEVEKRKDEAECSDIVGTSRRVLIRRGKTMYYIMDHR